MPAASPPPPSSSSTSTSSSPSFPLLSVVSYNHELLKQRLAQLHVDWLYHYKLSTERSIDDQRKQGPPTTHTNSSQPADTASLQLIASPSPHA